MTAFQEGNIQDAMQYYEAACSELELITDIGDWCNAFESGEHFYETQFSWYIDKDELQSILSDYAVIFKDEDPTRAKAFTWCSLVLGFE